MEQNLILKLEDVQAGQAANDRFQHLTLGLGRAEILAVMSSRAYDLNNLIELLNGTLEASAGRLFLYGREYPLKELKNFHIVFAIRRNTLFDHFTIAQNMFIRGDCSKKKAEQLAKKQLEEFELDIDLNKNIAELTSGEQKVIEILRAYNCAPDIVVLYDAMNYVEKRFAPRMRSIFEKFREKGKSIIYLTTNLEDALMFSDRICLLGAGKVEAEYSTADIRKNPRELIYLMSGLESGHWDDSEEKLVLESIIETRDTLTSSYELKDTLGALAANISRVLNASSCIIYINDTTNLSMLDSVSSDDELAKNARLVPGCLHEFDGGMRVVRAADAPGEFPRYFVYEPPCHTFLVAPVTIKGQRMGYVQVSYQGAFSLTEEEKLYLSAFTREVALAIETSRLLGRSVLLQESHHRIKNNLQVIVNLLYMQRASLKPEQKPAFAPILNDIIYRIKSIALVHEMLSGEEPRNSIINLQSMVARITRFYSMRDVAIDLDVEPIAIPYNKATSIALIVNELISNCFKHAFPEDVPDKHLTVSGRRREDSIQLAVQDNGVGLAPGFDAHSSASLGMQIICIITKEFEGDIRFTADGGTRAELTLPLNKIFEVWDTGIDPA